MSGWELPAHWTISSLGQVCGQSETTDPARNPDTPFLYVDVSSVSTASFRIENVKQLLGREAPSRARKLIRARDVVFATVRPSLRRIAMVPSKLDGQVASTGFCVLRSSEQALDPYFLYFFALCERVRRQVEQLQAGVAYPAISDSQLLALEIPLPPLPEQRAIARALRSVQQAADARRRELALERERKAMLMASLFIHGAHGNSTRQTDIGPVPENWAVTRLQNVVVRTQYGLSIAGKATGRHALLRMTNLTDGRVTSKALQWLDLDDDLAAAYRLNVGDVVFNRTNSADLVGKAALFELEGEFVFASYLIRVVPDGRRLLPAFLNAYLNWDCTQGRLRMIASRGVSQSNISASKLMQFTVPIPPTDEQQEIVQVLDACDAKIAALESEIDLLNELFRAMLEELMSGRLSALPLVEEEGAA